MLSAALTNDVTTKPMTPLAEIMLPTNESGGTSGIADLQLRFSLLVRY